MATELIPKRFIPFSKQDLIQMTLQSGNFPSDETEKLCLFAKRLGQLLHLSFHLDLENFKLSYSELNPDRDTIKVFPDSHLLAENQQTFAKQLEKVFAGCEL